MPPSGDAMQRVGNRHGLDYEVGEQAPDLFVVVDGEEELAIEILEGGRHCLEVLVLQIVAVESYVVIGRIEIEKS